MQDIVGALRWRYAVKSFDPTKKIPQEKLNILWESLRLAPSSFGLQPWKFLVVEQGPLREQLLPVSFNQKQVVQADYLVVFCRLAQCGAPHVDAYLQSMATVRGLEVSQLAGLRKTMLKFLGHHTEAQHISWMERQIYIALGFFMETAALLNVDACPMEGFSAQEYDRILKLPDRGLHSTVLCPIGYRHPQDATAQSPKVRHGRDQVILQIKASDLP